MVVFINMFLYIAMVIPLSVNPISRPDIKAGHVQFFNHSLSDTQSNLALTEHPYFGLFFFDLLMM